MGKKNKQEARREVVIAERDLALAGGLLVLEETLGCAKGGCIPCTYKVVLHAGADVGGKPPMDLKPNQRPEMCPRLTTRGRAEDEPSSGGLHCSLSDGARMLTVGDGDLSFSLGLARALPRVKLTATSHESEKTVGKIYRQAATGTVQELRRRGASVLFDVDAQDLAPTLAVAYEVARILPENVGCTKPGDLPSPCPPLTGFSGSAEANTTKQTGRSTVHITRAWRFRPPRGNAAGCCEPASAFFFVVFVCHVHVHVHAAVGPVIFGAHCSRTSYASLAL